MRGSGTLLVLMLPAIGVACGTTGTSDPAGAGSVLSALKHDAAVSTDGGEESAMQVDSEIRRLIIPRLDYNARQGRAVFRHYCAPCHGDEGRGDGFNAYNLDPKPRDLTDPQFQARQGDEDFAAVVRAGGGVAGLSAAMPPWGRSLSDRQILNVVRFIRTLGAEEDAAAAE